MNPRIHRLPFELPHHHLNSTTPGLSLPLTRMCRVNGLKQNLMPTVCIKFSHTARLTDISSLLLALFGIVTDDVVRWLLTAFVSERELNVSKSVANYWIISFRSTVTRHAPHCRYRNSVEVTRHAGKCRIGRTVTKNPRKLAISQK